MNASQEDSAVVLLDRPSPLVARLRINRAEKRNAIDHAVRLSLVEALDVLHAHVQTGEVRALVFGGMAGVFSAGGDLPSMHGLDASGARARMTHIHGLCRQVANIGIPVVSAIEGVGAGAAVGLALLGDRIVVGERTKILFPFLQLGLAPDWGQLLTLPRRVGLPVARRILTAGQAVSGPEALRIGLADALVDDAAVMDEAVRWAAEAAGWPTRAFARMKARLGNVSPTLDAELARELDDQVACLTGDDFREGFAAFQDKRKPDFVDRGGARA